MPLDTPTTRGVIDLLAGMGLLDSNGRPLISTAQFAALLAATGTPWINATPQNGWVAFGGNTPPSSPQYRKDGLGFVHTRGAVKLGTAGAPILVYPPGFLPAYVINWVFPNGAGSATAGTLSQGGVLTPPTAAGNAWVGLDLPPFLAEA